MTEIWAPRSSSDGCGIRASGSASKFDRSLSLGNRGDARPIGEGVSEMRINYGRDTGCISPVGAKSSFCSAAATGRPRTTNREGQGSEGVEQWRRLRSHSPRSMIAFDVWRKPALRWRRPAGGRDDRSPRGLSALPRHGLSPCLAPSSGFATHDPANPFVLGRRRLEGPELRPGWLRPLRPPFFRDNAKPDCDARHGEAVRVVVERAVGRLGRRLGRSRRRRLFFRSSRSRRGDGSIHAYA
jgi:hypothetical protein